MYCVLKVKQTHKTSMTYLCIRSFRKQHFGSLSSFTDSFEIKLGNTGRRSSVTRC